MDNIKTGCVMITTEEYKNLVLIEKELEEEKEYSSMLRLEKNRLKDEFEKLEEELKELLLAIVKEPKANYDNMFQIYDIKKSEEISAYIEEHYSKNGMLQFRKNRKEERK